MLFCYRFNNNGFERKWCNVGRYTNNNFVVASIFLARRLCKFWDEHKASKRPKDTMQSTRFCNECGQKLLDNSKFCSKCGADTSNGDITERKNERFCDRCGADISHDKDYCHICYNKFNETNVE